MACLHAVALIQRELVRPCTTSVGILDLPQHATRFATSPTFQLVKFLSWSSVGEHACGFSLPWPLCTHKQRAQVGLLRVEEVGFLSQSSGASLVVDASAAWTNQHIVSTLQICQCRALPGLPVNRLVARGHVPRCRSLAIGVLDALNKDGAAVIFCNI